MKKSSDLVCIGCTVLLWLAGCALLVLFCVAISGCQPRSDVNVNVQPPARPAPVRPRPVVITPLRPVVAPWWPLRPWRPIVVVPAPRPIVVVPAPHHPHR